ncbi:MAG: pilus assembly PilX family protein [Gaiellaceae bacterium]
MNIPRHRSHAGTRHQSGVVMIITLISLVILLIGGIALIRSFGTAALFAGNFAVKRDLLNQSERGIAAAVTALSSGALATETVRTSDLASANYVSSQLASNAQGIPLALVNDTTYASLGLTLADIDDSSTTGIKIRYVIDRQCVSTGTFSTSSCLATTSATDKGGSDFLKKPGGEARAAYRVTVRVTDTRRNTQTYAQLIVGV